MNIENKYVSYSHETALMNPSMIDREYQHVMAIQRAEIDKIKRNTGSIRFSERDVSVRTDWSHVTVLGFYSSNEYLIHVGVIESKLEEHMRDHSEEYLKIKDLERELSDIEFEYNSFKAKYMNR